MTQIRIAAAALAFACALAGMPRANAQELDGYTGKGALVVQTAFGGDTKVTVGGNIAFEAKDRFVRIDVLSLGIPGMDSSISSMLGTQLFPPGGFTVVYDRTASSYTVWSNAKHNYYTNVSNATPQPTPVPTPQTVASAPPAGGNIFAIFNFLKSLKDDKAFTLSLSMSGHGTVNGHPATGMSYQYLKTTKSGETSDLHGAFQLADDLDEIPVQITASVKTPALPQSALRLDITQIAKTSPPQADFDVPQGYNRATSLGDVIGKVLPQ